jgi:hypothetical protein
VSVHPDRGAWVVRWRNNGAQRARRFKAEAEALAFDEGVSGAAAKPRSSTPNVYPYETPEGTRWRSSYCDSRGRLSTKRGFLPSAPRHATGRKARPPPPAARNAFSPRSPSGALSAITAAIGAKNGSVFPTKRSAISHATVAAAVPCTTGDRSTDHFAARESKAWPP